LTVRNGSEVEHAEFEELDEAVAAMRERAMRIRADAPPKTASLVRTFTPADQVQARLQISGRGLLRKPVAGVDVRGDGRFVPFQGAMARTELDPSDSESPFQTVREALGREGE
jgi:hypothetical protein